MKLQDALNKNILFTHAHPREDGLIYDGTVRAFSASGQYVCIGHRWYEASKIAVLEEVPQPKLAEEKPAPPRGNPTAQPSGAPKTASSVVAGPFGPPLPQRDPGPVTSPAGTPTPAGNPAPE